MAIVERGLYYQKSFLGRIGERTGNFANKDYYGNDNRVEIKVGDVISFRRFGRIYTRVAAKDEFKNTYGVFGFGTDNFNFEDIQIILTHEQLTEDIFRKLQSPDNKRHQGFFTIRQIDVEEEYTVEELEEILGKKIKIVGGK